MKTRRKLVGNVSRFFENEEQIDAYLAANPLQTIAGIMNANNMNPHKRYSHISVIFNVYEEVEVPEVKPMFG